MATADHDFHEEICSHVEDIECKEQSILQHIRTSGLKKVRENTLTEEMMELRRCRRRVFRDVITRVCSLEDLLKNQGKEFVEKMNTEVDSRLSVLEREIEFKNKELVKLREKYIAEIDAVKQNHALATKEKVLEIRSHYEAKMQLLEAKFSDLSKYRKESQESHIPREIAVKQMEDMQAGFDKKAERYHSALSAMTQREEEYQTAMRKLVSSNKELEQEIQAVRETFSSRERNAKELISKLKEELRLRDEKVSDLERCIQDYGRVRAHWQSQVEKLKVESESSVKTMQEKHRLELETVDEKVRKALQTKDDLCRTLKQELKEARQRIVEMESALKHLSQDISGIGSGGRDSSTSNR